MNIDTYYMVYIKKTTYLSNHSLICFICFSANCVHYYFHQDTWFDAQEFCNKNKSGRLATFEEISDVGLNCNQSKDSIYSSSGSTYWTGNYKTNENSVWIHKLGKYLNACVNYSVTAF